MTVLPIENIRVVSFDATRTLIHLRDPVGVTYAAVAQRFGLNLDPAILTKAFIAAWRTVPPAPSVEGPRIDDGRNWWEAVVRETMRQASYLIPEFSAYFATLYDEFTCPAIWYLESGTNELLADLRNAGYRLGVLSNFDRRLYRILDQLGIGELFEQIVISSEVGADKPDPCIFRALVKRFGVSPEKMLHVGDDPVVDGEAARGAGLHAFVIGVDGTGLNDLRCLLRPS
jgi:putative hydrolase of the HAD superfamily